MPSTYEKIATAAGTGSNTTLTFSSIPSTYTDLVLVINGSLSTGNNTRMTFNNDSGSNYSMTVVSGDGSSASSYRDSGQPNFQYMGYTDSSISNFIINILNYSNTTTYKTFLHRRNLAGGQVSANVGLYRSTSAVNRVDVFSATGATWTTSTTATLYGIKAA